MRLWWTADWLIEGPNASLVLCQVFARKPDELFLKITLEKCSSMKTKYKGIKEWDFCIVLYMWQNLKQSDLLMNYKDSGLLFCFLQVLQIWKAGHQSLRCI